jgi:hypothetical protein
VGKSLASLSHGVFHGVVMRLVGVAYSDDRHGDASRRKGSLGFLLKREGVCMYI